MNEPKIKFRILVEVVLFILLFLYCFSFRNIADTITFGDEAFILNISRRMLYGDILYKEIKAHLLPGTFYLVELSFKIMGVSLLTARFITSITVAGIGLLLFKLSIKITGNVFFSFIPSVLYVIFVYPLWYITSYYWFFTFFTLLSLLLMINYIKKNKTIYLFFASIIASISIIFVQNRGIFLLTSLYLFLVLRQIFYGANKIQIIKSSQKERLIFLAGTIPVFISILIMFFYYSPEDMLTATFFWLFSDYTQSTSPSYFYFSKNLMFHNLLLSLNPPYPIFLKIIYLFKAFLYFFLGYSYFIIFPLMLIELIRGKNKIHKNISESILLILLSGTFIVSSSIIIKSDYHGMLHCVYFSILIFLFLLTIPAKSRLWKIITTSSLMIIFLVTITFGTYEVYKTKKYYRYPVDTAIGKVFYAEEEIAKDYTAFIQYINLRKEPTFFCAFWCSYYYLITGKPNPAPFEIIYPGLYPKHYEILFYDTILNNHDKLLIYDDFLNKVKKINPFFYTKLMASFQNILENNYYVETKFEKIGLTIYKRKKLSQ